MRGSFLATSFLLFTLISSAQNSAPTDTSYWLKGGLSTVTFSQVSLSNWAAGGENSASVSSFLTVFADRIKKRSKWNNTLDLAYGLLKQGKNSRVLKSDDKINLATRYGYRIVKDKEKWYLTSFLDFRSQFAEGFAADDPDSVISKFMAPGYFTIGTGIEYSPVKHISMSYEPVTGKITVVGDSRIVGTDGAYGVRPGKTARYELGSYFRFSYKKEAFKNVKVDSRLELFTNYQKSNFGNIDVNWQSSIVMRVNEYLTTNFMMQLIYDDDIKTEVVENGTLRMAGALTQFKSVFGVGLAYQFGAERPKK